MWVSLVVPVFNEAATLPRTIPMMLNHLRRYRGELIAVDDGSTDESVQILRQLRGRFPQLRVLCLPEHRGKGAAVRRGILAARGTAIGYTDADLAYPLSQLPRFLRALQYFPVVVGNRRDPRSSVLRSSAFPRSLMRFAMRHSFNSLATLLLPLRGIEDTQCGFKCFQHPAAKALFTRLRTTGLAFDVELLVACRSLGYRIMQLPVTVRYGGRPSRIQVSQVLGMLIDLLRIFLRTYADTTARPSRDFSRHPRNPKRL